MADNGAHVVMTDIDEASLITQADRLAKTGNSVERVTLDVTNLEALSTAIRDAAAEHGRLDAMFANAGISPDPVAAPFGG